MGNLSVGLPGGQSIVEVLLGNGFMFIKRRNRTGEKNNRF
ncbi:unknown [Mediterraneibacter gnavus CAG:126]|uniref:Uncharacterized protein n=1 Tax=Mediterraneibacter gnavus CAG:126 TaxID=1263106 RepID=R5TYH7_MEDGN|nr:unknown [Mediterraneibacter gnavus CAG:126]SCI34784.1 Uncharacterised protein [uncultured Ruminococcus sp.]